jgi:hypothetical protein
VVRANSASLEPSVATSILVGKMLIGPRLLVLDAFRSGSMMPDVESPRSPGSVIHLNPGR